MEQTNSNSIFHLDSSDSEQENYIGTIINSRFIITEFIDSGSFGKVYKITDIQVPDRNLVVKIQKKIKILEQETKIMVLTKKVVQAGSLESDNQMQYIIMERYGQNLHEYFALQGLKASKFSILALALNLLDHFKIIHEAGYTYNDLKLDNILIDYKEKLSFSDHNIFKHKRLHLIDFGFSKPFLVDGQHIHHADVDYFMGNVAFASFNQMNFQTTSRKDDLISLLYLMVFLFNQGTLLGINVEDPDSDDFQSYFDSVKHAKACQNIEQVCCENAVPLREFARSIFALDFESQPDYEELKNNLIDAIDMEEIDIDEHRLPIIKEYNSNNIF